MSAVNVRPITDELRAGAETCGEMSVREIVRGTMSGGIYPGPPWRGMSGSICAGRPI